MSLQNLVLIINVYQLFISPISSSMFCLSLPLSLGCATEHCMCAHERNMYLGPNTRIQKLKKDAKVSSPHIWRWSGTSVKYPVLPSRFAHLVYAPFMELLEESDVMTIGSSCPTSVASAMPDNPAAPWSNERQSHATDVRPVVSRLV